MPGIRFVWPKHAATVGAMIEAKTKVKACCERCGVWQKVPLQLIGGTFGKNYSLINKSMPCACLDCPGQVKFYVQGGQGVPYRPMTDPAKRHKS